jgi:hypothetical protein
MRAWPTHECVALPSRVFAGMRLVYGKGVMLTFRNASFDVADEVSCVLKAVPSDSYEWHEATDAAHTPPSDTSASQLPTQELGLHAWVKTVVEARGCDYSVCWLSRLHAAILVEGTSVRSGCVKRTRLSNQAIIHKHACTHTHSVAHIFKYTLQYRPVASSRHTYSLRVCLG